MLLDYVKNSNRCKNIQEIATAIKGDIFAFLCKLGMQIAVALACATLIKYDKASHRSAVYIAG